MPPTLKTLLRLCCWSRWAPLQIKSYRCGLSIRFDSYRRSHADRIRQHLRGVSHIHFQVNKLRLWWVCRLPHNLVRGMVFFSNSVLFCLVLLLTIGFGAPPIFCPCGLSPTERYLSVFRWRACVFLWLLTYFKWFSTNFVWLNMSFSSLFVFIFCFVGLFGLTCFQTCSGKSAGFNWV